MEDTALVTTTSAMAVYGDREEVNALADRIMVMLPQVAKVGKPAAFALAQVAVAMRLNPFVGEIWAIPDGRGGFNIMGGIKGLRRAAHRQAKEDGGMYTVFLRVPRGEEVEGLIINKGDIVRACDVTVSGKMAEAHRVLTGEVPRYTGIGIYRNGESTRMNPLQVARKRAEADALKQAFDLPLAIPEEAGQTFEPTGPGWDTEAFESGIDAEIVEPSGALPTIQPPEANGGNGDKAVPEPARPELYEYLPIPTTWGDLWGGKRFLELGYRHKNHALGVIRQALGDPKTVTVEAAWQVLIDHQLSKLAVEPEPTEPEPETEWAEEQQEELPF